MSAKASYSPRAEQAAQLTQALLVDLARQHGQGLARRVGRTGLQGFFPGGQQALVAVQLAASGRQEARLPTVAAAMADGHSSGEETVTAVRLGGVRGRRC